MKIKKTTVIFRLWQGHVVAVFPEEPADDGNPDSSMSYRYNWCRTGTGDPLERMSFRKDYIKSSVAASESEFRIVRDELESIGYNLSVRWRFNWRMSLNRRKKWLDTEDVPKKAEVLKLSKDETVTRFFLFTDKNPRVTKKRRNAVEAFRERYRDAVGIEKDDDFIRFPRLGIHLENHYTDYLVEWDISWIFKDAEPEITVTPEIATFPVMAYARRKNGDMYYLGYDFKEGYVGKDKLAVVSTEEMIDYSGWKKCTVCDSLYNEAACPHCICWECFERHRADEACYEPYPCPDCGIDDLLKVRQCWCGSPGLLDDCC